MLIACRITEYSTVTDMPAMNNILIIIGHRFGHQSDLDES